MPALVTDASTPRPGLVVTRPWRIVLAALSAVAHGSLVVLALIVWFAAGRLPTGTLLRAVELLCFAPGLAAWLLGRVHAGSIAVAADGVVLRSRAGIVEIPLAGIAAVFPWRVPLPAPGFSLQLTSGERLPEGIVPDDPATFLVALADAGVPDAARHPLTAYTAAKHAARRRIDHPFVKFVLFSLVPTLPLFRLRQLIVYGGAFGEYQQYGLRVYLLGFAIFWLLYAIYLLLYAAALRALTELASLVAAWRMPAYALRVRRVAESVHRILYFAGVPAVLALRLFPW
jgi:apolipoprotein N-acyltransferase